MFENNRTRKMVRTRKLGTFNRVKGRPIALHVIPSYSKRLCLPIDPALTLTLTSAFAQFDFTIKS